MAINGDTTPTLTLNKSDYTFTFGSQEHKKIEREHPIALLRTGEGKEYMLYNGENRVGRNGMSDVYLNSRQ
eukprot:Ihof_evm6s165 gene=Ihof_evmTU6s165